MKYNRVFLDSVGYELGPNVISSTALEKRLESVYRKLHLQPGQLESLTGIRERRFWDPGFRVSEGAIRAGRQALEASAILAKDLDAVIYAGVCREGYEPATACAVAAGLGVSAHAQVFDLSNACLGVLNGCLTLANMIELGQIKAGMVVSCESAREITDVMIERMNELQDMETFRLSIATLTGGSGAVAVILTDGSSPGFTGRRQLLGGVCRTAPQHNGLCQWGPTPDGGQLMRTDATGVLRHGVELGRQTWAALLKEMDWVEEDVGRVICHQVGEGHRTAILNSLGIKPAKEFSTFEYLANMGTVSLPLTAAIADERGFLEEGQRVAFLGIGSGLNCMMLGWSW
jgi:3-oxoacyl-[acyl-carrier-protein] synthase III